MQKDISLEGSWFLPNSTLEERYVGTLTYTAKDGCRLRLYDGFPRKNFFEREHIDIIQGIGIDPSGKSIRITLAECIDTSRITTFDVLEVSIYSCQFAFLGRFFDRLEDLDFSMLSASLEDFDNWMVVHGFKHAISSNQVTVDYTIPETKKFSLKNELEGSFSFTFSLEESNYPSLMNVAQVCWIDIVSTQKLSFELLLQEFFSFYKFIGLAYGSAPPILQVQLAKPSQEETEERTQFVQLLYHSGFVNKSYAKGRSDFDFLFNFKVIEDRFPTIILKWFQLKEQVGPSIDILNELLLNKQMTNDILLIRITQALESFHRELYSNHISEEEEADRKTLEEIISAAPANEDWLRDKLKYSLGWNLRRRLKDIIKKIPHSILRALNLGNKKDQKLFIEKVTNSRNHYTHFGKENATNKLQGGELVKTSHKLKVFLICLFLKQLGFEDTEIVERVATSKVYPFRS